MTVPMPQLDQRQRLVAEVMHAVCTALQLESLHHHYHHHDAHDAAVTKEPSLMSVANALTRAEAGLFHVCGSAAELQRSLECSVRHAGGDIQRVSKICDLMCDKRDKRVTSVNVRVDSDHGDGDGEAAAAAALRCRHSVVSGTGVLNTVTKLMSCMRFTDGDVHGDDDATTITSRRQQQQRCYVSTRLRGCSERCPTVMACFWLRSGVAIAPIDYYESTGTATAADDALWYEAMKIWSSSAKDADWALRRYR